jgi:conjugal transfer mating pair stabilization protein TraG
MNAHLTSEQSRAQDPYLVNTFNEYMNNCVGNAILAGDKLATEITYNDNLVDSLEVSGNYFETIVYNTANPYGVSKNCEDAWNQDIRPNVVSLASDKLDILSNRLRVTRTKLEDGMSDMSQMIFGVSKSAQDYVTQQTLKNMTKDGLNAMAIASGGDPSSLAFGTALATSNQQSQWMLAGTMAKDNLPMMKAVFQLLFLGIFLLLALMSIIFGKFEYIKTIFIILTSLILWTPMGTIINFLTFWFMEFQLGSVSLTMADATTINENMASKLSYFQYTYTIIPILAYAVAKGSEQAFSSLFSSVGSGFSQSAMAPASQTSTGNLSLGNTRVGGGNITDEFGTHNKVGNDMYQHTALSTTGSGQVVKSDTYKVNGETMSTTSNAYGDFTQNSSGELTKVSGNFNHNQSDAILYQNSKANQQLQQASESFITSASSTFANTLTDTEGKIDNTTLSEKLGLSDSSSEAVRKSMNKSLSNVLSSSDKYGEDIKLSNLTKGDLKAMVSSSGGFNLLGNGATVSADGSISISGQKDNGESWSMTLSGDSAKAFKEEFSSDMSKSISKDKNMAYDISESIINNESFSNSKAYQEAKNYQNALSNAQSWSDANSIVKSMGNSTGVDLTPKIIENFIGSDERLSHYYNSDDNQAKQVAITEAQERIDKALKTGAGVDYQAWQDSVLSVTNEKMGSIDKGTISSSIDNNTVAKDIETGKNSVDNTSATNNISNIDLKDKFDTKSKEFSNVSNKELDSFSEVNNIDVDGINETRGLINQSFDKQKDMNLIQNIGEITGASEAYKYVAPVLDSKILDTKDIDQTALNNSNNNANINYSKLAGNSEFQAQTYQQAINDGLLKDEWGADGIKDSSVMSNYSNDQLQALLKYDGVGTNGLDNSAKDAISAELSNRATSPQPTPSINQEKMTRDVQGFMQQKIDDLELKIGGNTGPKAGSNSRLLIDESN